MPAPREFDLVVIGVGPAALTAAYACREAGWTVAMIDSRPFGGTCPLRGCDPKKMLAGAASLADWHNRMRGNGIPGGPVTLDWADVVAWTQRAFVADIPERTREAMAERGVEGLHGRARFVDAHTVEADGQQFRGQRVLVATGAKPLPLDVPGAEHLTDSTGFMRMEEMPRRVVMLGGGYIALEFAHIAARAGAEVTIVEMLDRILTPFDPDMVDLLARATRDAGIAIRTGHQVTAIEQVGGGYLVRAEGDGGEIELEADLVVHAAGRIPEIDDLDLEAGGIEREKKGITVNEYLQSVSNPAVYAAGDCAASGGLPLTPIANLEGEIAAENLLNGNTRTADYTGTASVVYAIPPLATVGLTEADAREQGFEFDVHCQETTGEWFSAIQTAAPVSGYKTLVERGTGRVLGAHLIGPHAPELINLFALAIRTNTSADALKATPYAYPTAASDVKNML